METKLSLSLLCIIFLLNSFLPSFQAHRQHSAMNFLEPLAGATKGSSAPGLSKLKIHLSNLGYLESPSPSSSLSSSTHDDLFDDNLEQALRNYQAFFKLPPTAALDDTTLAHLRKPRCGVRDHLIIPNTTAHYKFFPGNPKWPAGKRHLTYSFPAGTRSDALNAIQHATKVWANSSPFTFEYTSDYNGADIKISFQYRDHGDGKAFDGSGGILAHAFAPTDGRLHYDGDETWVDGEASGKFDLQTVGLHELGHVLGLEHSSDGRSIMFPTIDPGSRKYLGQDDVDGIWALYS